MTVKVGQLRCWYGRPELVFVIDALLPSRMVDNDQKTFGLIYVNTFVKAVHLESIIETHTKLISDV